MNATSNTSVAPLLHMVKEEVKEKRKYVRQKPKPVLSAEEAKKEMGAQVAYLREFSGELTAFVAQVSQAIATGDFGPSIVEAADRILKDGKDFKDSVGKVYDIALERNYARLPPRRKK